jgi:hypothetical protein
MRKYNVYDIRFKRLFVVEAYNGAEAIKAAKEKGVFAPMVHELDIKGNEIYRHM